MRIAFALFTTKGQLRSLVTTRLLDALFMLAWSQIGFAAAPRGVTRNVSSVSQVGATKYGVLVEHRFVEQARGLLAVLPVARS